MLTGKRLWLPALILLVASFWIGGCSDNPASTSGTDELNLTDDFGGYKSTPEEPGFGDETLLADDELEVEIDDPILSSPEVTAITSDPEAGFFHFRAVWGQIPYDSTATDPIDWSGSLSITRGAEVVRRFIRFEPSQDWLLPRTDRKLIEWVSQTTVHNDGIAVDLFVPRPVPTYDSTVVIVVDSLGDSTRALVVDTIPAEPVTVTFETDPYSRTFTLGEIAKLDTLIELDNGASVALHGIQLYRVPCPGGFVVGGWGFDEEGQGVFRGRWMNYAGEITGWLDGHFGRNEQGQNVMFGKWINEDGSCEGFLKGTYYRYRFNRDAATDLFAAGAFAARVYNAQREPIGVMHGQYQSAPRRANGFFQGRWRLTCNQPDDITAGYNYDDGLDNMMM